MPIIQGQRNPTRLKRTKDTGQHTRTHAVKVTAPASNTSSPAAPILGLLLGRPLSARATRETRCPAFPVYAAPACRLCRCGCPARRDVACTVSGHVMRRMWVDGGSTTAAMLQSIEVIEVPTHGCAYARNCRWWSHAPTIPNLCLQCCQRRQRSLLARYFLLSSRRSRV